MLHLILVGEQADGSNEAIAEAIKNRPRPGVVLCRCSKPGKLVETVADARELHGNLRVDILDIVDHAHAGAQFIGSEVLFGSDTDRCTALVGKQRAVDLRDHLAETAHVRLLGCNTAGGDDPGGAIGRHGLRGRQLLYKLSKALAGHRLALGTLRPTHQPDFKTGRFLPRAEDEILISSQAVIDLDPPTDSTRLSNLGAFRCDS